jgi:hypothetical protein
MILGKGLGEIMDEEEALYARIERKILARQNEVLLDKILKLQAELLEDVRKNDPSPVF